MGKDLFIGLDVGTDSVGYAVTDSDYNLVKHNGEPMWGSMIFEAAKTKEERRQFRSARRRLDRRQQRITLTQEIFAKEISKVDEKFFIRIKESGLYREDTSINSTYFLFEDNAFSDIEYHKKYPTIHHLIQDLMNDQSTKDVRLVYLAVAWFMGHRGHFLNEVDKTKVSSILNFDEVYDSFMGYFDYPLWETDKEEFKKILLKKISISKKEKEFFNLLNEGKKYKNSEDDNISKAAIIKLLSGGKIKPDKIYLNSEYEQIESVSLDMPEDKFSAIVLELGDDGELLVKLRAIYDWSLLNDILGNDDQLNGELRTISKAKVAIYEQHQMDVKELKKFVRKYIPQHYHAIFRDKDIDNYAAYSGHQSNKRCDKEAFSMFLLKYVRNIDVAEEDRVFYEDMKNRLELRSFLPKQVNGDNRVIPYQLYWYELHTIVENAKNYLPFLNETDEEGYSNAEKIMSIFEFRIPYFVGPLRTDNSKNSWMKRKVGQVEKIYPWNFNKIVDLDATEQCFINRMINKCTYLPSEEVLPKYSLLYSKFMVLNEINNIKVNGIEIPVDVKQQIYEKFKEYKRVTIKMIRDVLIANGCMKSKDVISGLDQTVKSSLVSYHAFKRMLENGILMENEVEEIIRYLTYSEDKPRFKKWLDMKYPKLSLEDKKYIAHMKFKDFGRLSYQFLLGMKGIDKKTGEVLSVLDVMWQTNHNLMQVLSNQYSFAEQIQEEREAYYSDHNKDINSLLDDMYISNSVKRPIYRTLAILEDIRKATKTTPKRIFIEMARGGGEKGKRTKSRREQIKELYAKVNKEEVRELSRLLDEKTDNELQSEVLYLYFMQLGRCMYSGLPIHIEELKTSKYNVDHIYPQSKVMDDSLNNKVLVLSTLNGDKGDTYPVPSNYRQKDLWMMLKDHGLISEEKYKRLTRVVPFTEEELQSFINRQLVETRQSTKALANILQRIYPETEIVYVKAGLVSEFRKEFEMVKSRQVNDFHHGKDAYLNIVCGNVYHCRFTKNFYINQDYSLKVKTLFTHNVKENGELVWSGEESIAKTRKVMMKNNLHYTRFAFERKGGLFDQNPVKAGKGAIPRKKGLSIEKYGGYNKSTASFFLLVQYSENKKTDIMIMPVDLWVANTVMTNEAVAMEYAKRNIAGILGKQEPNIEIHGFPLGLRKIKINTILSLDGFKVSITGKTNGGKQIGLASMESLVLSGLEERYVKRIERFVEKKKENRIDKIDEIYDKITKEENLKLYDRFSEKLKSNRYNKLFGNNEEYLIKSRAKFEAMSLESQAVLLMNILSIFRTGRTTGCDLRGIGGKENSAILTKSSKLSNWKTFKEVRIVDMSSSGIYVTQSDNLLELL